MNPDDPLSRREFLASSSVALGAVRSAARKPRRRRAPRPGSRSTAARRRSASGSRNSSAGASPRRNGSTP